MAEMTEARRAAWQAEEDRKVEVRREKRRARAREAQEKSKNHSDSDLVNESVLRLRWLEAYTGPANGNHRRASEIAGYPENQCNTAGLRNRKHFAPRLAKMAEEHLSKSTLVEMLWQNAQGVGDELSFNGEDVNILQTVENLQEAGKLRQITSAKTKITKFGTETEIKFIDSQAALFKLIDIAGLAAPTKITGTLTLEGLTPAQIRDKALSVIDDVIEEQRKMLNAPSDEDYDIPEADMIDEDETELGD